MRQLLLLFSFLVFTLADQECPDLDQVMVVVLDNNFGDLVVNRSRPVHNFSDNGTANILDNDLLTDWENAFILSAKNNLTQMALSRNTIDSIIVEESLNTKLKDEFLFSEDVEMPDSDNIATRDLSWLLAFCNILRNEVIDKYGLDSSFEVSPSYLYFYDQLEKANLFLEKTIELGNDTFAEVIDDISSPINEDGNWQTAVDLVNKYGLVPSVVFPNNRQFISTGNLKDVLTRMLREFALKIRQLVQQNSDDVEDYKETCLQVIYNTLASTLGTPPKPNDVFSWEFINSKDGNLTRFAVTPLSFYEDHVNYDANGNFMVMNDPRLEYNQSYYSLTQISMVNGTMAKYVNVEIDELKQAAINMLKDGQPVFVVVTLEPSQSSVNGVFDTTAFDYPTVFNYEFSMSKQQRLVTSAKANAGLVDTVEVNVGMIISAVYIDPDTNTPIRWKAQKLWNDIKDSQNWVLMSDDWFEEYVLYISSSEEYVSQVVNDAREGEELLMSS